MNRYRTLYLLLSSLPFLLGLGSSCARAKYRKYAPVGTLKVGPDTLQALIPAHGQSQRYRASIDVLNRHFSGLVLMKQTDSLHQHLVFVTELGMKMLDFEISGFTIRPVYVFEPLKKPALINSLSRDFEAMLLLPLYRREAQVLEKDGKTVLKSVDSTTTVYTSISRKLPLSSEVYVKKKRRIRTDYLLNDSLPIIRLKQYGLVKLRMELTKMPDTP